jgi:hypothetical protein
MIVRKKVCFQALEKSPDALCADCSPTVSTTNDSSVIQKSSGPGELAQRIVIAISNQTVVNFFQDKVESAAEEHPSRTVQRSGDDWKWFHNPECKPLEEKWYGAVPSRPKDGVEIL